MEAGDDDAFDLSDSDEEIRKPAIPFEDDGKPMDETQAPVTGLDYLRRVHREAKKCAKVCVANIPATKLRPITREIPADEKVPPPKGLEPTLEWQQARVAHFSSVRQRFALFKQEVEISGSALKKIESSAEWFEHIHEKARLPLVSVVASLSGKQVLNILEYHVEWIQKEFSWHHGLWIFSMLVALEKPLSPHACDIIRSLARAASKVRARLDSSNEKNLTSLNLIICLIARYFSQMDLCD